MGRAHAFKTAEAVHCLLGWSLCARRTRRAAKSPRRQPTVFQCRVWGTGCDASTCVRIGMAERPRVWAHCPPSGVAALGGRGCSCGAGVREGNLVAACDAVCSATSVRCSTHVGRHTLGTPQHMVGTAVWSLKRCIQHTLGLGDACTTARAPHAPLKPAVVNANDETSAPRQTRRGQQQLHGCTGCARTTKP